MLSESKTGKQKGKKIKTKIRFGNTGMKCLKLENKMTKM